jgi:hypothetical protein
MIPAPVLPECREEARRSIEERRPANRAAAAGIVVFWLSLAALAIYYAVRFL